MLGKKSYIYPEKTESVARETLWVCKKEFIPIRFEAFDVFGEKIISANFKEIELNVDLEDRLFMKIKRSKEDKIVSSER